MEFLYSLAVLLSSFAFSVVLIVVMGYYHRWKILRNCEGMESSFTMGKEGGLPTVMGKTGIVRSAQIADDAKSFQSYNSDETPSIR